MTTPEDRLRRALSATPEAQRDLAEAAEDLAPPGAYLIRGGSPFALQVAAALEDPARRATLEEWGRVLGRQVGWIIEDLTRAMLPAMVDLGRRIDTVRTLLREAGVLPEEPPTDPRERALWLRQHRGTGPDQQLQHARRPRRIA